MGSRVSDLVADLRNATTVLQLIQRRESAAWPLAEKLAEMFVLRCVHRLTKARGPDAVFVPLTEADLVELFGAPAEVERRNQRSRAA
jgi:hypothetical protein